VIVTEGSAGETPANTVLEGSLVDRDVIDHDPALGQQLLHVAIGQPIAQVPTHRHGDHLH
jgi:hypothetical protein